uniref:OBP5 n=1 Tax=Hycleus cichorii TaxID=1270216 RepID=A0A2U9NK60_9CUCU|nr:OBP5 [Hycleus cichorii]
MKFIIIFLSVFVYSQAIEKEFVDNFLAKLKEIGEQCLPETGASTDDLASLWAHTIPESHEGKCLILCYHKYFNMQDDDGNLSKDGFLVALEPLKEHDAVIYEKFLKIYDTCSTSVGKDSDPCQYAADLTACAIKEGHAMGLKEELFLE